MAFDAAAGKALFDQLISHALTLGVFDRAASHEPKSAPGSGISYALWLDSIDPLPNASGLAAVSGRVAFGGRIYMSFNAKPEDSIDPRVLAATCALLAEYSGNFTLGGTVRNIDLLGEFGEALSAQAAYMEQDGKLYRVMDIKIPVIINDLWTETP